MRSADIDLFGDEPSKRERDRRGNCKEGCHDGAPRAQCGTGGCGCSSRKSGLDLDGL